jgi:hypothetical protein
MGRVNRQSGSSAGKTILRRTGWPVASIATASLPSMDRWNKTDLRAKEGLSGRNLPMSRRKLGFLRLMEGAHQN